MALAISFCSAGCEDTDDPFFHEGVYRVSVVNRTPTSITTDAPVQQSNLIFPTEREMTTVASGERRGIRVYFSDDRQAVVSVSNASQSKNYVVYVSDPELTITPENLE